jgi:hypothetical protein
METIHKIELSQSDVVMVVAELRTLAVWILSRLHSRGNQIDLEAAKRYAFSLRAIADNIEDQTR